jgi:putative ATPase
MTRTTPLADLLRARSLEDVYGQDHLVGPKGIITSLVRAKRPLSLLLWGPPGVGKTSIARLYAEAFAMRVVYLSATASKISDVKGIIEEQNKNPLFMSSVMLFMDEIHRFNKAQQDTFLPHIENGSLILVGATTENPSFYLNGALLSRMRVLSLNPLGEDSLSSLLCAYEKRFRPLPLTEAARVYLLKAARGDGRTLFNLIENLEAYFSEQTIDVDELNELMPKHVVVHDRAGDQHYNLVSALHKSVRASDADGALYWFARMMQAKEDPLFVARRLIRMASEDIGLADPQALAITIAARDSFQMLGSPEGELALAEAVVYLALAPKSNAVYTAYKRARAFADETSTHGVPRHLLNAPTSLMKQLGYGQGYVYEHDTENGFVGQQTFPDSLEPQRFYQPKERGFEREMAKRLRYFHNLIEKQKF